MIESYWSTSTNVGRLGTSAKSVQPVQETKGKIVGLDLHLYTDDFQVRCSGDRPACKRCARLKHNCVYAVLAATSPSNDHVHPTGMVFSPPGTPVQGHPRTSSSERITSEVFAPQMWTISNPATPEKTSLGIPNSLVTTLVDVYYTHVYNASLMLHRTSFLQQLESGTVAPALLLSICAFASMYEVE